MSSSRKLSIHRARGTRLKNTSRGKLFTVWGKKETAEVREGLPALVPRLWRDAMALTGRHRADAEHLTHAAMLRVLERAGQYRVGTVMSRLANGRKRLNAAMTEKADP